MVHTIPRITPKSTSRERYGEYAPLLLLGFSPDEVTVVEPDVLPAD